MSDRSAADGVDRAPNATAPCGTTVPVGERARDQHEFDLRRRFPVVDANIELQKAETGTSRLGLTGIYRPTPIQPNTSREQVDAGATIRQFLGRLATILTIG